MDANKIRGEKTKEDSKMNPKIGRHTEYTNRGMTAEYKRNQKVQQKEYARAQESTIIVSNPGFFDKLGQKWRARRKQT